MEFEEAEMSIPLGNDKTPKKEGRTKHRPTQTDRFASEVEGPLPAIPDYGAIENSILKPLRPKGIKIPFPHNIDSWDNIRFERRLSDLSSDLLGMLNGAAPLNDFYRDGQRWTPTRTPRKISFNEIVTVKKADDIERPKHGENEGEMNEEAASSSFIPRIAMRNYPYQFNEAVEPQNLSLGRGAKSSRRVRGMPEYR